MEQPDGTRRCYYDIMELETTATDDEIRRQYKKLSLKHHPDKNIGNAERAMAIFKQVQAAYAVLSDAQEKAWYDSHRQSILTGDGEHGCDPDGVDIYHFMTPYCYTGLGDDEEGFFTVYNRVFVDLAKEEVDRSEDPRRAPTYPKFGVSTDGYLEVAQPFYIFWGNYTSRKSFAWKDEYKTNDIPDRDMRRAAERHNKKLRDAARKEFTALIREFVEYVRRRDPRVSAFQEKLKADDEAKERAREEREEQKRKARYASNQKIWQEAAEMEAKRDEERLARGEDLDQGATLEVLYAKQGISRYFFEEDDTGAGEGGAELNAAGSAGGATLGHGSDLFKCPACKKSFKTEKLWTDHERSSKHKTKLKQLAAKGVDVEALMAQAASPLSASTVADAPASTAPAESPREAVNAEGGDSASDASAERAPAPTAQHASGVCDRGEPGNSQKKAKTKTKHADPTPLAASSPAPPTAAANASADAGAGGGASNGKSKKGKHHSKKDDGRRSVTAADAAAAEPAGVQRDKDKGSRKQAAGKKGFLPPTLGATSGRVDEGESGSSSGDSDDDTAPAQRGGGAFSAFASLSKKKGKR